MARDAAKRRDSDFNAHFSRTDGRKRRKKASNFLALITPGDNYRAVKVFFSFLSPPRRFRRVPSGERKREKASEKTKFRTSMRNQTDSVAGYYNLIAAPIYISRQERDATSDGEFSSLASRILFNRASANNNDTCVSRMNRGLKGSFLVLIEGKNRT